MKRAMVILAYLWASQALADEWTSTDTAFQFTYTALHVVDMLQTHTIAENPHRFVEINPVLGVHPSHLEVNAYFLGTLAAHWTISRLLPQPYRRIWQVATSSMELAITAHNININIGVSLPW